MKRSFLSTLLSALAACLLLFNCSAPALAAGEEPVYIQISAVHDIPRLSVAVFTHGDDFLMEAEWFARLTLYTYGYDHDHDLITFTRGAKQIRINPQTRRMTVFSKARDIKLTEIKQIGEKYYLPLSELLPWMNTYCSVQEGVLNIVSDPVSIWDLVVEFDPEQVIFDFVEECKKTNVNSFKLKTASFLKQNGLGDLVQKALYFAPGVSTKEYRDYYNVFEEILQDRDSIYDAGKILAADTKRINSAFDLIKQVGELERLPDELQLLYALTEAADRLKVKECLDLLSYQEAFARDNSSKLSMLDNITLNRYINGYPEPAVAAAMSIQDSYTDNWKGIENIFLHELLDWSAEALAASLLPANLADICKKADSIKGILNKPKNWKEKIASVPVYTGLQNAAYNSYLDAAGYLGEIVYPERTIKRAAGGSKAYIERLRLEAMLLLSGAKLGYQAMMDYFAALNRADMVGRYAKKIKQGDDWYARFLASSLAEINDSGEDKQTRAGEIRKLLKNLDRRSFAEGPAISVVPKAYAGWNHSLALKADGSLWAWGSNCYGQLGLGTVTTYGAVNVKKEDHDEPKPVEIMDNVIVASAGSTYSLAVTSDYELYGWGDNRDGQLGLKGVEIVPSPVKIMDDVIYAETASLTSAVLRSDNSLWLFGWNYTEQRDDIIGPTKIMDNVKEVSLSDSMAMALTFDGELYMWGKAMYLINYVGNGDYYVSEPVKIMDNIASISGRSQVPLVVTENGELYAWGFNGYDGSLGTGSDEFFVRTPALVLREVKKAASCSNINAAIKNDHTLWIWGANSSVLTYCSELGAGGGQVLGELLDYGDIPVKLMDNITWVSGVWHILAIDTDNILWGWGSNQFGVVGDGTVTTHSYKIDQEDYYSIPVYHIVNNHEKTEPVKIMSLN